MHGTERGVALYFADQLNRYVAIPFGDEVALVSEMFEEKMDDLMEAYEDVMRETIFQDIDEDSRWKLVRARVRDGKIQRRKKVSALPGFTFRKKGAAVIFMRIPVGERIRRKRGAKRGRIKRRGKEGRANLKRRRSMSKRNSLGL